MKAPDIRYECPTTIAQALALMSADEYECQPLAGGQSLLPMMHLRVASPEVLLDLNKLVELDFITEHNSYINIGAMVRYSALMDSQLVQQYIPLFSLALPHIAHAAIRNRGTIGGSIALADPAAEMPALLLALNATIVVASQKGQREIPADEFFLGIYETALAENELVYSIKIPVAASQKFGFYELARRHGDYAMAGVAISAQSVEPYNDLRIAFFSIADRAVRAHDAESALNGAVQSDNAALKKAQESLSSISVLEDAHTTAAMKKHLSSVVLARALRSMVEN